MAHLKKEELIIFFIFLQELKELCGKALSTSVDDANCFDLLELADLHGVAELKRAVLAYMKVHARRLVQSAEWKTRMSLLGLLGEMVQAFVGAESSA
jgi:hypothetical protein